MAEGRNVTVEVKRIIKEQLDVDEKDKQVWILITDVPLLKSPWQYICFILNVIIPGTSFSFFSD